MLLCFDHHPAVEEEDLVGHILDLEVDLAVVDHLGRRDNLPVVPMEERS